MSARSTSSSYWALIEHPFSPTCTGSSLANTGHPPRQLDRLSSPPVPARSALGLKRESGGLRLVHNRRSILVFARGFTHICGVTCTELVLNVALLRLRLIRLVSLHMHATPHARSSERTDDYGLVIAAVFLYPVFWTIGCDRTASATTDERPDCRDATHSRSLPSLCCSARSAWPVATRARHDSIAGRAMWRHRIRAPSPTSDQPTLGRQVTVTPNQEILSRPMRLTLATPRRPPPWTPALPR